MTCDVREAVRGQGELDEMFAVLGVSATDARTKRRWARFSALVRPPRAGRLTPSEAGRLSYNRVLPPLVVESTHQPPLRPDGQ